MRISDATVALASAHYYREESVEEETLRLWVGSERPDFEADGEAPPTGAGPAAMVTLSAAARQLSAEAVAATTCEEEAAATTQEDPKLRAIRMILEILTGKKIRVAGFTPAEGAAPAPPSAPVAQSEAPPRQGWGLEYDAHTLYREVESIQFAASGEIRTADGRSLTFSLELTMQREFVQETFVSLRAGDALLVDPLVVNFDGTAAQLTDQRFLFDLDLDGRDEAVPMLAPGSGFLALDRNGDGRIDSGAELFGPSTGNGFAELRDLDSDGNGWLDENDPLFAKLRIWMRDAAGNDALYTLREKNIGALLLDRAATPFSLTDSANALQGRVRESSIFITEDGRAGTVQEIDLAV